MEWLEREIREGSSQNKIIIMRIGERGRKGLNRSYNS